MTSLVIRRNNWLFSTSPTRTEVNPIWMPIISSAKANGINESEYPEFLLKHVSQLRTFEKESKLEAYLPWNYAVASKIALRYWKLIGGVRSYTN